MWPFSSSKETAESKEVEGVFQEESKEKREGKEIALMTGIPLHPVEKIDFVFGTYCYSINLVKDIGSAVQNNTFGGELKMYSSMISVATQRALNRLKKEAAKRGADGVYGVQIATPQVSNGAAEIIAYGTAYKDIIK